MLNTDLHDPRLKSGKSSRKPMSKEVFIKNLRTTEMLPLLDDQMLASIYDSVALNPIEWQEDKQKEKEKLRWKRIAAGARSFSVDFSSPEILKKQLESLNLSFCRVPPPPPTAEDAAPMLEKAVSKVIHRPSVVVDNPPPLNHAGF